jgi:hypothetical protein
MPVEHMVWMKFKPGVDAARIKHHLDNLTALPEHVPAISALRLGQNFTDRANGYTHGFIVTVETREDLPRYLQHPHHVTVATPLKADADLLAMDIEAP